MFVLSLSRSVSIRASLAKLHNTCLCRYRWLSTRSTPTRLWFGTKRASAPKLPCFFLLSCASPTSHLCWSLTGAKVNTDAFSWLSRAGVYQHFNCVVFSGFWIKRSTYEEQPVVRFQYQTLLLASTSTQGDYVAWSTFPHLNNMLGSNLRIPAVSVRDPQLNNTLKTH